MTLTVAGRPGSASIPEEPPAQHRRANRTIGAYFREPGWPLAVAFVPFALWWALGITEVVCVAMAVPMALYLLRQRRVDVPRGFGFWLILLVLVAAGVLVLQVNAAGAVPSQAFTRYFTWAYRLLWYLACTIAALYVLNTRKHVPLERVSRIVSCLFLTIVAGGVLGLVAPHFQFTSFLQLILPQSLTSNSFVHSIIHPSAAQLQDVLGHQSPRPSAPYTYTNTWGLNFCLTLPFFVHAWCGKHAGWRRWVAPVVLLIATVTAIESVNRGLWLALAVMAVFLAIRSALVGRPAVIAGLALAGVAIAVLISSTSLGNVVTARLSNPGSEQGRQNLSTLSVTSVAQTSPVVGLGSTRNVQGNFQTIAGGATAMCPHCSPPALGTQGQVWLVVFSQGLLGLAMFLAFFAVSFFGRLRRRTAAATLGLLTIVASAVTSLVYVSLGTGLFVVMIGIGLLSRDDADNASARPARALGDYVGPVVRRMPVLALCAVLGALAGFAVYHVGPKRATAVVTVVVSPTPAYELPPAAANAVSVDTLAQLFSSDRVLNAVGRASGRRPAPDAGSITVSATPNTRTLHIAYTAATPTQARAGAEAAASAFLHLRGRSLAAERASSLRALRAQADTINFAENRLRILIHKPVGRPPTPPSRASTIALRDQRAALLLQQSAVQQQLADIMAAPVQPGAKTQPPVVHVATDSRQVDMVSGAVVAFLLGALGAIALGRRGRRVGRRQAAFEHTNLPVLATLALHGGSLGPETAGVLETAVAVYDFGSCVPADDGDVRAVELAGRLQDSAVVRRGDPRVGVVVIPARIHTGAINHARAAATRRGINIIGVIVVADSTTTETASASNSWLSSAINEEKHGATNAD